jgi:hypothetical protein
LSEPAFDELRRRARISSESQRLRLHPADTFRKANPCSAARSIASALASGEQVAVETDLGRLAADDSYPRLATDGALTSRETQ